MLFIRRGLYCRYSSFFSGKAEDLLGKLREGTADIVILSGEGADITDPNLKTKQFVMDENEEYGLLVWNDLKHSCDRDRVLFIIENENYHLKRGYCEFAE